MSGSQRVLTGSANQNQFLQRISNLTQCGTIHQLLGQPEHLHVILRRAVSTIHEQLDRQGIQNFPILRKIAQLDSFANCFGADDGSAGEELVDDELEVGRFRRVPAEAAEFAS